MADGMQEWENECAAAEGREPREIPIGWPSGEELDRMYRERLAQLQSERLAAWVSTRGLDRSMQTDAPAEPARPEGRHPKRRLAASGDAATRCVVAQPRLPVVGDSRQHERAAPPLARTARRVDRYSTAGERVVELVLGSDDD